MLKLSRPRSTQKHVDKKLRNRLRLYLVISIALLAVVLYDIVVGIVPLLLAFIGMAIGGVVGILASRMYHLSWDHDGKKVVSRMDVFGIVILVLYIASALVRRQVIGYFVHGPAIGGVSFALVTGIMFGRVFGMRGRIIKVLKEQDVF